GSTRGVGEPFDHVVRTIERLRIDPADRGPVGSEDTELLGELAQLALDHLEADMTARRDEVRRVEPRAHHLHRVAVQLAEIDPVEALRPHGPQRAREIAGDRVADRPELKPDT